MALEPQPRRLIAATEPRAMDIDAYLDRIGLAGQPAVNLEGLTALHRAHPLAIPFENLDVQFGRPVSLALEPIFDKLVTGRRVFSPDT